MSATRLAATTAAVAATDRRQNLDVITAVDRVVLTDEELVWIREAIALNAEDTGDDLDDLDLEPLPLH